MRAVVIVRSHDLAGLHVDADSQDALVLSIARSLSLGIVASTQTVEGVEARLGEKEAAQYLTLFGSVIPADHGQLL